MKRYLFGWLAVGILDMLDAYFFFGFLLQHILYPGFSGSGRRYIGREAAIAGGVQTGMIGLALHYVVAFGVALVFYLALHAVQIFVPPAVDLGAALRHRSAFFYAVCGGAEFGDRKVPGVCTLIGRS